MNRPGPSLLVAAMLIAPTSQAADPAPEPLSVRADTLLVPSAEARAVWNQRREALQPADATRPSSEMHVITLPSGEQLAVCSTPGLAVDNLQGALRRGAHRAELPR